MSSVTKLSRYFATSTADKRGRNDGRSKDPTHQREMNNAWNKANRDRKLLYAAKDRAKKKGLELNIDHTDIIIPTYCPILGMKLEFGGNNASSPSLDRIDSTKGYIKGNVHVISKRANTIKNDATPAELIAIADYIGQLCQQ